MPDNTTAGRLWRKENADVFAQTVAAAAEQLAVSQLAVGKDYWVCQALRAVTVHVAGQVVFKGGTSLENLRLVQRFSEDLDLLVTGRWGNKRATERALKAMCDAAVAALPGATQDKLRSGGTPGTAHRAVYLHIPPSIG